MPESLTPELPGAADRTDSATVKQHGTPPFSPSGSATETDGLPCVALFAGGERYELLEEIARGGMGIVFRARDRVLNRDVGLKTVAQTPPEPGIVSRFLAEARITGQLQHPNVPPVHDLGTLPDGRPFLVMKLIKGRTLEALLSAPADAPADRPRLVAAFEAVAQALAYAHDRRVIHRDIKPQNVMVGDYGEVQLMDWGLAKVLTDAPERAELPATETAPATAIQPPTGESDRTRAGSILGTPAYMPPEQAIGAVDQIDARSDVFGLGALLCAILTGHPPYVGGSFESTRQLAARARLDDAFARLDASGAEPGLVGLCKWCLAAERDDRPKSAGAVVAALRDWEQLVLSREREAAVSFSLSLARKVQATRLEQTLLGVAATALLLVGGTAAVLCFTLALFGALVEAAGTDTGIPASRLAAGAGTATAAAAVGLFLRRAGARRPIRYRPPKRSSDAATPGHGISDKVGNLGNLPRAAPEGVAG